MFSVLNKRICYMSFKQTFLCDMSVDVKELGITHNKGEKRTD